MILLRRTVRFFNKMEKIVMFLVLLQLSMVFSDEFSDINSSVKTKPEVFDVRNGTAVEGTFGQIQFFVDGNPTPSILIQKQTPRGSARIAFNNVTIETVDHPTRNNSVVATLNFSKVEIDDEGLYECYAQNEIGSDTRNAHLTVEYAPIFDPMVNILTAFSWNRRPVNLTCIAKATPNATIDWYFNNKLIERSNNFYAIYGKGSPSTLQVTPFNYGIYGFYKCTAENKLGKAIWNINLKEAFPPNPVVNFEVDTETAFSITFRIQDPSETGGLPIKVYIVQYISDTEQWSEAKNVTWARGALYTVHDLIPAKTYTFRFAAVNDVGLSGWSRAYTRQMPDQSPPSEPIITNAIDDGAKYIKLDTAKQFELKWKIPSSNGLDIDGYLLKYCPASMDAETGNLFPLADSCVERTLSVDDVLSAYEIRDLSPDSYYLVSLKAHNGMGDGPASQRYFKTSDELFVHTDMPVQNEPNLSAAPAEDLEMSSTVLIYIIVATLIALVVIVDVFFFFYGKTGVLHLIYKACLGENRNYKLGSLESAVMLDVPTNDVTVMTHFSDSDVGTMNQ